MNNVLVIGAGKEVIDEALNTYNTYAKISGGKINEDKISLLPISSWKKRERDKLQNTCEEIKFLGTWFNKDGLGKEKNWEELIKAIQDRLELYKHFEMSLFSKAMITNSIAITHKRVQKEKVNTARKSGKEIHLER